jgi:HAD superfamily hydrolase (TIGR01450 family)
MTTARALIDRYDGFLIDAYGVLVHGGGPFAGAARFLRALEDAGKPWLLVSNDASKTPEHAAERYHAYGFPITPEHVLNAGMLIGRELERLGQTGATCRVLGPPDSAELVRRAGGVVLDLEDPEFQVLVLCDESGYPLLQALDDTLTCLVHAREQGRNIALLLPNPDLTYPRGHGAWGFASGALAGMLEAGLHARLPGLEVRFTPLGKPHPPIFARALESLGTRNALMIGDQLPTDIRGGHDAGLDTALATWGVTRWPVLAAEVTPTWLLEAL